ncbi:uncharacterized protein LOC121060058 [Cygnus olor]|uniref:uncharacterized protein LOC121060058 n=1 Tax=Cygnus olor TaxID=8869 RepID=UPI001ADE01DD|nr:uncharacterized protein LOC121060058 [Cygnus olor]XP_040393409.1 uncharacterized protein LOC121060058 [Cygnus olor]XP_040393410.1 uncharacterized protein LOC121060058 [Cygnus olor]
MPTAARRAGRGSLVPARVFGRVSPTSCQINIYSPIYLFAFVAENSRGVFFFLLLFCFVLFCSPCVFLAARRWREGLLQLCWLQPFQLLPPARRSAPLLYGGARLAAAFSPLALGQEVTTLLGSQGADLGDRGFPRLRYGGHETDERGAVDTSHPHSASVSCRNPSLWVSFGSCCWFVGTVGVCTAPVAPRGLQDPPVSTCRRCPPAPWCLPGSLHNPGPPALRLPSAFIPITANLPVHFLFHFTPGAKQRAARASPSLQLRSSLPRSHRLLPGARRGAARRPPCPGSPFPALPLVFLPFLPPCHRRASPEDGDRGSAWLRHLAAASSWRGSSCSQSSLHLPKAAPDVRGAVTEPELGVP